MSAAARVRDMPAGDVTVGLWLAAVWEIFPGDRKPETAEHDAYMLRAFAQAHGSKPVRAVTAMHAQHWALKHPSQVRYLRRAWKKAVLMGVAQVNVWRMVEMPKRKPAGPGVPSLAELDGILERCRGWWPEFADVVEFAAFTGARSGGVASLTRSQVDLGARRVVLLEKGGKARTVVVAGRSRDALERALPRHDGELVFLSRTGRRHDRWTLGEAWRAVRGDFTGGFHALKHFAGTWMAAQGVDERDIAIQLGHTDAHGRPYTDLVRRVYVHPGHDEALERIEQVIAA